MDNRPIGIMDSGVGGLTVARALAARYPREGIIFIGDTLNNPYGSRMPGDIERLAGEMKTFLLRRNVKMILIACNTISFNISGAFLEAPVPIVKMSMDVEIPSAARRVGIFATPATIATHAHKEYLMKCFPQVSFIEIPVEGAAAAIERGEETDVVAFYVRRAMEYAGFPELDTGLWACTHYPLEPEAFREVLPGVSFIDPAEATVEKGMALLKKEGAFAEEPQEKHFYFTSGISRAAPLVRSVFGNAPVEETNLG